MGCLRLAHFSSISHVQTHKCRFLLARERISRQRKLCLLSHLHAIILGHNRIYERDERLNTDPVPVQREETSPPPITTETERKRKEAIKRGGNVSANVWHVHVTVWTRNSKLRNIHKTHNSQNGHNRNKILCSQFSLGVSIWIMCSRTSHVLNCKIKGNWCRYFIRGDTFVSAITFEERVCGAQI